MDLSQLEKALREFLPDDAMITQNEGLRVYESDGLTAYRQRPGMVLLPRDVDEVVRIMKLCHDGEIPVVARGAGTGLSGGALPLEHGVLLSLARFNAIIEIDPDDRLARVQPGVTNLAISEAAAPHGLYYAPDPSSQIACTIGGNVAENSGGVHCLKYGLTVHNILSLDIVTAEGERVRIGCAALDSPGYDLLALMTGSEGMLGIITEVTVKLLPQPVCMKVVMAAFDAVEAAGDAVSAVIAGGIVPAGLEMMDALAIQAAEDFVHAGYPTESQAMLLCEVDGTESEVERQVARVEDIMRNHGATSLRTSRDEDERQALWQGRKAAFPAVGRISPDYYCMDGTIPRHQIGRVLLEISRLSEEYGLKVANVFHAGDGNLHPLILYDANNAGELERAEQMGGRILELSVSVGGTITGEHGVGVEKIDQMCVQFHDDELDQFHRIKRAFDPRGILNPGKAIPTLKRCAEFGAMHVHGGDLPFPELERF